MGNQLASVANNDDFFSTKTHKQPSCKHMIIRENNCQVIDLTNVKEKRSYEDAKKRAAAVADMLDW